MVTKADPQRRCHDDSNAVDTVEHSAPPATDNALAVAKERTVVPARLATVYSSDEAVAAMLRERAADLRGALARITGHSEWGVKAHVAVKLFGDDFSVLTAKAEEIEKELKGIEGAASATSPVSMKLRTARIRVWRIPRTTTSATPIGTGSSA